jgi:short-subunit dehydrogenase
MVQMQVIPRAALITGASSGIGASFAHALPSSCTLVLTGRDQDALSRQATMLGSRRPVDAVQADLSTDEGLDAVCDAAERAAIDLLICNAGIGSYGDFLSASETALRNTVAVNVAAPVVLIHRLLPGMITRAEASGRRAGLIVVSSSLGFVPTPRLAAYAASKAFTLSLTEALAAELATRPVAVLVVCPTATRSRFAERSGFGAMPLGAQSPDHVARQALRALGRQRTLVLGPVTGSVLSVPALVRAGMAQALQTVLPFR